MADTLKCALCGAEFDIHTQGCHPACPMGSGCGMVCCPRCGYGVPQAERGLAKILKNALVKLRRTA